MAILGLTDHPSRLPRIGTIHKGAPKPERGPGRDLNYFRLASEDPDLMMAWESAFGDKPTSFPVYLAYDDPDNSFDTSREEFVAGGLIHRCDGETCQIRLIDGKNYSREPAPCPYAQTKYTDSRERPCKPIGKLRVIVPELRRIGVLELGTHSLHDIISLSSNISLYALLARQAGRPLSGIPFILSRREREISTPSGTTGRARRKVSLVSLDIDPRWAAVQLASRERDLALESANTPLQLPAGTPEELVDPDDEQVPLMPRPEVIDLHRVATGTSIRRDDYAAPRPVPPTASQQPAQYGPTFATPAQVRAIYAISKDHFQRTEHEVDEQITAMFGMLPTEITRKQASEYIAMLQANRDAPKQATTTPQSVVKTPDNAPARPVTPSKSEEVWKTLVQQIPEMGLDAYFIPHGLPLEWTPEEVREGGKAFRAFVDAWKRMAKPDELTALAEVIVAIRKEHGEEPAKEEVPTDAIPF